MLRNNLVQAVKVIKLKVPVHRILVFYFWGSALFNPGVDCFRPAPMEPINDGHITWPLTAADSQKPLPVGHRDF